MGSKGARASSHTHLLPVSSTEGRVGVTEEDHISILLAFGGRKAPRMGNKVGYRNKARGCGRGSDTVAVPE